MGGSHSLGMESMSDDKLLPCPFCGSQPEKIERKLIVRPERVVVFSIECGACGAAGPITKRGNALNKWNTRESDRMELAQKAFEDLF